MAGSPTAGAESPTVRADSRVAAGAESRIAAATLAWFRQNRRPLPFRETTDPYRVWVSEVMLQQTRVEAMTDRYTEFVARFPDVGALAAAPEEEVLAAWAGLGYYGRARSLHRAARQVAAAGGFPGDRAGFRALPGVGEYTAAAVRSIAAGERVAAVDGNVRRVVARLFAIPGLPGRRAFEHPARRRAEALLAAAEAPPGEWNQALMELGALLCAPASPRCGDCPAAGECRARALGATDRYPERPPRRAPVPVRLAQGLVLDDSGRMLVFRRREPPLRGLWELPGGECRAGESAAAALVREARARYGRSLTPREEIPSFRHAIMDRRITVHTFAADLDGPAPGGADGSANPAVSPKGFPKRLPKGRWVRPEAVSSLAAGAILRKTAALWLEARPAGRTRGPEAADSVDTLPGVRRPPFPP